MIRRILKCYDSVKPFIKKLIYDNIFAIAGQSAFFLILSAVPLLMFVVSMLQNLHIPLSVVESTLGGFLSKDATNAVFHFLNNMYESTVGISIVTVIATLWSASQGLHAITNGFNRVHNTFENRNWFLLRIRAMIYTLVIFVMIVATMLIVALGSTINNWLSPHMVHLPDFVSIIYYFRYIIVFLYLVVIFALFYRNLPNLSKENRKAFGFLCQLPGALFSAVSWVVLAFAISIYVDNFNGYSIYGGLTRVAVMMVWLYFCMVCLMIGAEFNFFYHKQIDRIIRMIFRKKKRK